MLNHHMMRDCTTLKQMNTIIRHAYKKCIKKITTCPFILVFSYLFSLFVGVMGLQLSASASNGFVGCVLVTILALMI